MLVPFVLLSLKKNGQKKLGDAGTIDRFGLVFQSQMIKIIKTNGKNKYKCIKANASVIIIAAYAAYTTN